MYTLNTKFLLIFGALCLVGMNAGAAPSVRVLGANNSATGTGLTAAKTGDNVTAATATNVKKASIKTNSVATQQVLKPTSSATTNRIGTAATAVSSGRLPVITSKNNLQTSYKPTTTTTTVSPGSGVAPGISAADIAAMSDKIESLQQQMLTKAEAANYYDKDQIDAVNDEFDGKFTDIDDDITDINSQLSTINSRIDGIDTSATSQQIEDLQNSISVYRTEVNNVTNVVNGNLKTIYDAGSNSRKMVRLVDGFNPDVLTEPQVIVIGD